MNTLELWPALHKTALLGTARAGESLSAPQDAPQAVRAALDGDREGALLSLLAACSLARRAGAVPLALEDAAVAASICPDEARTVAPAAACARLRGLNGAESALLSEWLQIAREKAVVAPHDALPGLLRLGSRSKAVRADLLPVLGARGRWLAAQNQEWAWARGKALQPQASADEAESAFRDGEGTARTEAFALLRSLDAARGLQVLADAWSRESANRRAQWVEMLQPDLGEGDEEFLERALDDRSEAVRKMAAQVLVALAASAFARRAIERCDKYLRMEKRDGALHLEVSLPTVWDESWARDGLDEKGGRAPAGAPAGAATGQRMWWLIQMVAATPPSHWEAAWSAAPSEILEAMARDESALVEGLSLGGVRARDSRWLMALLSSPKAAHAVASGVPHHFLLSKVDPAQRDALLCVRVREVAQALAQDEMDNVLGLLRSHAMPWSRELSLAVVDWMRALGRRAIDEGRRSNASQWQFPGGYLLHHAPQFAPLMHLDALATVDDGWPSNAPDFFETARTTLRDAHETRRAMRREFES